MKTSYKQILPVVILFLLASCIKDYDRAFTGNTVVEIDATVLNSVATGLTYPVMTRIPIDGRVPGTADSTVRRLNGTIKIRVNLVGPQSATDQTIGYKVMTTSPITSIAFPATATGQTPSSAAATLTVSNAVAGTHFTALSGTCTIPANSSFGYINIPVINTTATAGQARFLGIELDESGTLKPSVNYNKIAIVIDQR